MKHVKPYHLLIAVFVALLIITTACGASESAVPAPAEEVVSQDVAVEVEAMEEATVEEEVAFEVEKEAMAEEAVAEPATEGDEENRASPVANRPNVYNRLIIKNGEIELLVEDTDTAINRAWASSPNIKAMWSATGPGLAQMRRSMRH